MSNLNGNMIDMQLEATAPDVEEPDFFVLQEAPARTEVLDLGGCESLRVTDGVAAGWSE